MIPWLKILCALDFSEGSRSALEYAADLTHRFGAELTLLHVREAPRRAELHILSPPELEAAEEAEVARALDRWREEAERLAGRPVHTMVASAPPAEEIVRLARAGSFDLVVTGTHARKGLGRLLLGSVAERVVREAPCPVLVARAPPDAGD
ncbi:MAG TPA: universal stress protein [Anaeromyxobacter sp.]|nr:universal stress protein [Anaeromyxobacter sp.]